MRIPLNIESALWAITAVCFALAPCGLPAIAGCGASPQTVKTASDVCTSTLVGLAPIQTEARKLDRTPEALAREVCEAAILAAELAASNIPKATTSTPE